MRQYAWYSPELDVIVIQIFKICMDGDDLTCEMYFQWCSSNAHILHTLEDMGLDAIRDHVWLPLGEV